MKPSNPTTRGAVWAALAFYCLIAFEFVYMASPFALYFYSAYRPGLNGLAALPGVAWLSTFFLPHIVVDTRSALIDAHNLAGGLLFGGGLLAFGVCAGQVYFNKLARRGAVLGGLYRYIRHPQYAAFLVSSFGMLLLWPRFLALILLVTVGFVYYFLARVEESECEQKFGPAYVDYKNRTGMFLPFKLPQAGWAGRLPSLLPGLPKSGARRGLAILALYALSLAVTVGLGYGLKRWALSSLYALYTSEAAYVAVAEMTPEALEAVKAIALEDGGVQARLADAGPGAQFINYVLPTEWSVAEIPMNGSAGHRFPRNYDRSRYKVVFTRAQLPAGRTAAGDEILLQAVHKVGVVEVWVDLEAGQIEQVMDPPETVNYEGVPVPIY